MWRVRFPGEKFKHTIGERRKSVWMHRSEEELTVPTPEEEFSSKRPSSDHDLSHGRKGACVRECPSSSGRWNAAKGVPFFLAPSRELNNEIHDRVRKRQGEWKIGLSEDIKGIGTLLSASQEPVECLTSRSPKLAPEYPHCSACYAHIPYGQLPGCTPDGGNDSSFDRRLVSTHRKPSEPAGQRRITNFSFSVSFESTEAVSTQPSVLQDPKKA